MNQTRRQLDKAETLLLDAILEHNTAQILDYNSFSINLLKDDTIIVFLYNGLGSHCQTNKHQKETTLKQFYCFQSIDSNQWYEGESGCGCADFQRLYLSELPNNWIDKAVFKEGRSAFRFRPAGRC